MPQINVCVPTGSSIYKKIQISSEAAYSHHLHHHHYDHHHHDHHHHRRHQFSAMHPITRSIIQGSGIGPTLWIVMASDLCSFLT